MTPSALTPSWTLDLVLALAATAVALAVRPWRSTGPDGPPWPWLAVWIAMPVLWGIDRYVAVPLAQPMSGTPLLVLMAGWPLAVLATLPVALVTGFAADLGWAEALHRLVWLGVVPATLMLLLGAGLRRWAAHHLFVYILGRGFFATFIASALSDGMAASFHPLPVGSSLEELWLIRPITAFGEAFLTGMLTAILVAFRPACLATYSDRLYLPK